MQSTESTTDVVKSETTVKATSEMVANVRQFIRKNGKVHPTRLAPIVFHDNRNGGAYVAGRNLRKREKRAAELAARKK